MSLASNTSGLEEILAAVNALPDAGGGAEVKTKTGTLTFPGGFTEITVNIGFSPDVMMIWLVPEESFEDQGSTYYAQACADFTIHDNINVMHYAWSADTVYDIYFSRKGNDVSVIVIDVGFNWANYIPPNCTFNYKAYKFT